MRENSIYHISPPDMKLLDAGPVVTVLSNNSKFLDSTKMTIKSINDQVLELIKISQIDVNTLQ